MLLAREDKAVRWRADGFCSDRSCKYRLGAIFEDRKCLPGFEVPVCVSNEEGRVVLAVVDLPAEAVGRAFSLAGFLRDAGTTGRRDVGKFSFCLLTDMSIRM